MIPLLAQVPPMGRQELWHPISVHLPIALLVVGGGCYLLSALPWFRSAGLLFAARLNLWLGTVSAWVAIYTGHLADEVVSRTLCDPLVLESHEKSGTLMAWLFVAVVLLDLGTQKLPRWKKGFQAVAMLILLGGIPLVGYVGHLGGKLVYQQAAGVYHPSDDCSEFLPDAQE